MVDGICHQKQKGTEPKGAHPGWARLVLGLKQGADSEWELGTGSARQPRRGDHSKPLYPQQHFRHPFGTPCLGHRQTVAGFFAGQGKILQQQVPDSAGDRRQQRFRHHQTQGIPAPGMGRFVGEQYLQLLGIQGGHHRRCQKGAGAQEARRESHHLCAWKQMEFTSLRGKTKQGADLALAFHHPAQEAEPEGSAYGPNYGKDDPRRPGRSPQPMPQTEVRMMVVREAVVLDQSGNGNERREEGEEQDAKGQDPRYAGEKAYEPCAILGNQAPQEAAKARIGKPKPLAADSDQPSSQKGRDYKEPGCVHPSLPAPGPAGLEELLQLVQHLWVLLHGQVHEGGQHRQGF